MNSKSKKKVLESRLGLNLHRKAFLLFAYLDSRSSDLRLVQILLGLEPGSSLYSCRKPVCKYHFISLSVETQLEIGLKPISR